MIIIVKKGEDFVIYKCQEIKGNKYGKVGELLIIVCYMTVEGLNVEEKDKKYQVLQSLVSIYEKEKIVIMGDMNQSILCHVLLD